MAEAVVVSGVVTGIGDLLVQEGKFLSGVSNQVELLQTELKLVRGLLKDADARQDESEAIRQWVAELRDLAYEAEYIIANYALKVRSRKGRGVQKVLKRYACILCEGIIVHKVGSQIEDIRAKVSNLKTSFPENGPYGTKESKCTAIEGGRFSSLKDSQQEQRQTFYHLEDDVIGFDNDLENLVELLLKEEEDKRVASICGMGGLGKTTLAKMVYNDSKVRQHFDCFAWVCISQQCQKRRVWEEILISLVSNYKRGQIEHWSNTELVVELLQVQQNQKCFVVLDDIWKIEDWNILCEAFPMKNTRSKMLLTSRNSNVALQVGPRGFHHELQCLNHEKSWELLRKMTISWRSGTSII